MGDAALVASRDFCDAPANAVLSVHAGRVHYHDDLNGDLNGVFQPYHGVVRLTDGSRQLSGRILDDGFAGRLSGARCDYTYRFQRVAGLAVQETAIANDPPMTSRQQDEPRRAAPDPNDRIESVAEPQEDFRSRKATAKATHGDPPAVAVVLKRLRYAHAHETVAASAQAPSQPDAPPVVVAQPLTAPAATKLADASPPAAASPPPAQQPDPAVPATMQANNEAGDPHPADAAASSQRANYAAVSAEPSLDITSGDFATAQALALKRGSPEQDSGAASALAAAVPALQELASQSTSTVQGLAQYDLGYCYEHGVGVAPDKLRVYVYYIRASVTPARGSAKANDTEPKHEDVAQAALKGAQDLQSALTQSDYNAAVAILQQGTP